MLTYLIYVLTTFYFFNYILYLSLVNLMITKKPIQKYKKAS